MTLTQRQQQIKDEFIAVRGTWSSAWDAILELDAEFLRAYLEWSAVPLRKHHLDEKVREFIFIAADAAATHLYEPGIRQHVRAALDLGASAAEVMEVLELTSTLGIHACNIGVPILVEELEAAGVPPVRAPGEPLDAHRAALKREFEEKRGYWHAFWDAMLDLDPAFFSAYTTYSSVPWVSGTLSPKEKEFIYTAFDVAATHLYAPGLRQHIANAIGYGATAEELLEVFEVATTLGIHAVNLGVPILVEELRSAGHAPEELEESDGS